MGKKTRRIIEGTWECSSCGTKGILGRHKVCPHCGSPREQEEMHFSFGARRADGSVKAETVADPSAVAQAQAGADWHCAACGAGNRGDQTECQQCGAARVENPAPQPTTPVRSGLGCGLGLGSMVLVGGLFGTLIVCCGVSGWINRPIEVDASVSQRVFSRQVVVQRLTPYPQTGWRDALPSPAQPPGSATLKPGLGEIQSCETVACYARPPAGGRLVEVTGREWSRTIKIRPMTERRKEGWEDDVPSKTGSWPVNGEGGREGRLGASSCKKKERVPERCRMASRREVCGSERSCQVQDLGNGYAEEVCEEVPKYCTVKEEVCTPPEVEDWCSWTELSWKREQTEVKRGTMGRPQWPKVSAGKRARVEKSETNRVLGKTLAGRGEGAFSVSGDRLMSYAIGQQYFVTSSGRPSPVPSRLIRRGRGPFVDCGEAIAADRLVNRERCQYTAWAWSAEPPVLAQGPSRPQWPAVDLRNDGVAERAEWAEVTMQWQRDEQTYTETVRLTPAQADVWPVGRAEPIVVRRDGQIAERKGDWPGL